MASRTMSRTRTLTLTPDCTPEPGPGTPHCRFDVYDNALTAIYLAKRGKLQESRQARSG